MRTQMIFPSDKIDVIAMSREITKEMFTQKEPDHFVFRNSPEENLYYDAEEGAWTCSCSTYSYFKSKNLSGYEHFCPHIVAFERIYPQATDDFVKQFFAAKNMQAHKHTHPSKPKLIDKPQTKTMITDKPKTSFLAKRARILWGFIPSPSNRVVLHR